MTFGSNFLGFFIVCFVVLFLFSCLKKNYFEYGTYFYNLPKTGDIQMDYTLKINDPEIKIGDVLYLSATTVYQVQAPPTTTTNIPLTSTATSRLNLLIPAQGSVYRNC